MSMSGPADCTALQLGALQGARNECPSLWLAVLCPGCLLPDAASQLADAYAAEREALLQARRQGVAYLVGRSALRAAPGARWLKVKGHGGRLVQLMQGQAAAVAALAGRMFALLCKWQLAHADVAACHMG